MAFDATDFTIPDAPTLPTTPRERIAYLRDFLAGLPNERFDLSHIQQEKECGTVCCIYGWWVTLFEHGAWPADLNRSGESSLVMPPNYDSAWGRRTYTRLRAIRVLDNFLAEGVINWPRAMAEVAG